MSKGKWSLPAYQGKSDPTRAAATFVLVLAVVLLAGFIKAGLREGWFEWIGI